MAHVLGRAADVPERQAADRLPAGSEPRNIAVDHVARDSAALREPAELIAFWDVAGMIPTGQLGHRVRGRWWELLAELGITLLVSREYEHLLLALGAPEGRPEMSYMRLPHPSGIAVDRRDGTAYVAATRNPNQLVVLSPLADGTLVPEHTNFYAGSLYLHDLAIAGGRLYGNAVGQNCVVEFVPGGGTRRAWWPRVLDGLGAAGFEKNYLQLNSIAAGETIEASYFSASAARPGHRRPGHLNFRVDGEGVVFAGTTREVFAGGLTRPHSARLRGPEVWVANSGYGTLEVARGGRFEAVTRLPGWTRGLTFAGDVAFVGTSRVIPKFRRYAPGVREERCGLHAVSLRSGEVLGSIFFPQGNQIFAIDWYPSSQMRRLPFGRERTASRLARARSLFYSFSPSRRDRCLV